ncbi:MAG: cupin domain-containing protein [Candidatus Zipacnadales bacterium]
MAEGKNEVGGGLVEPLPAHEALDGSWVTELVRPEHSGVRNVSVAEAVIEVGTATRPHYHECSEEVYYVLSGKGLVEFAESSVSVEQGSCVVLPAGVIHSVRNSGIDVLKILCICSPPYRHDQTVLID